MKAGAKQKIDWLNKIEHFCVQRTTTSTRAPIPCPVPGGKKKEFGCPHRFLMAIVLLAGLLTAPEVPAQSAEEFKQLKAMVEQMQKTIEAQNARIAEMEKSKAAAPVVTTTVVTNRLEATSPSIQTMEKVAAGQSVATQSPITFRGALNDQQEAA